MGQVQINEQEGTDNKSTEDKTGAIERFLRRWAVEESLCLEESLLESVGFWRSAWTVGASRT